MRISDWSSDVCSSDLVNGGGAVLFNESPTIDGIRAIAEAHREFGTTAMLPTLISDDFDVIERGIAAVRGAIAIGIPGILGIHIEGPFLNVEKKGIHDASKIRKMDERAVNLLSSDRKSTRLNSSH